MRDKSLHYLFVLTVPFVAAIGGISGPMLIGMHHTGFIWPLILVAGLVLLIEPREQSVFPSKIWFPWYAMMTVSVVWSPLTIRPNLQDCLQLLTPPIVGLIAGCVRYDQQMLERFFKACVFSTFCLAATFVLFTYGFGNGDPAGLDEEKIGYNTRSGAMSLCIFGCVFIARGYQYRILGILGWLLCFSITILTGSRTASAALLIIWCFIPNKQRPMVRLLGVSAMVLAGMMAFATPVIQDRFFVGRSGSISEVTFDAASTAGRSVAWPLIWKEAKERPLIGHGVGSSAFIVERIWPGANKPHNDYLRITYEAGFVGVALFLAALIWQLFALWRIAHHDESRTNWPATAAFLGFLTLAVVAMTDNPIIYGVWFMNPLFALLGIAYSIRDQQSVEVTGTDA